MNMKLTKSKLKELIKEEFGQTLKEDIRLENLWEELEDLIAWIMDHSSDHEAVSKADEAWNVLEKIRNTYRINK